MKYIYLILCLFITSFAFGQPPFVGSVTGPWNSGATWGRAGNVAGTDYPTLGQTATINTLITVTVPSGDFSVGNLTTTNFGQVTINGNLTTNGALDGSASRGGITINNGGRLILQNGATVIKPNWARLVVSLGGILEMNYTTAGTVPAVNFNAGSILRFTGYSDPAATTPTFEPLLVLKVHVEWNCPNQPNDIFLTC